MRRLIPALIALLLPSLLNAAGDVPVRVDAEIKLSSAYLWRGDAVCGFHANPDICFRVGNLTLEHYDYLAFDGSYKELDWDLSYRLGDFTFHLADYYFYQSSSVVPENYFSWKKGATTHVDEVALVYESSHLPIVAKWFTFFWGDWRPDGSMSLSSYAELTAYHKFGEYGTASLIAGASVLKGSYTGYSKDFAPIHVELKYSKTLEAGDVGFPLAVSFVVNPYTRRAYAAASAGISF